MRARRTQDHLRGPGSFLRAAMLGFAVFAGSAVALNAQSNRIAAGDDYGAVIDAAGSMFLWGAILENATGGIEPVAGSWREVSVSKTAATEAHILAIAADGTLWAWGKNNRGQLGAGDQVDRTDPVRISALTDWVEVAAGARHSMARRTDGSIYVWGDNTYGQLNLPTTTGLRVLVPTVAFDSNGYLAISAGDAHAHAIRSDGSLWTWGTALTNGQVSGPQLGVLVGGSLPIGPLRLTRVGTAAGWTDLFGGRNATFATRDSGTEVGQLWVWGYGSNLGLGSTGTAPTPTRVGADSGWISVSFSSSTSVGHALGLRVGGMLYGWGINYPNGALGLPFYDGQGQFISGNVQLVTPQPLPLAGNLLAVGAGTEFSTVIDATGAMLSVGVNDAGQLANGTIDSTAGGQGGFGETELGAIDLEAVSVALSSAGAVFAPGDQLTFDLRIKNNASGVIDLSGRTDLLQARLVPVAGSAGAAQLLTGLSALPAGSLLGAFGELSISLSATVPSGVDAGHYQLAIDLDPDDRVLELSEANNTVLSAVSEASPGLHFSVDLTAPSGSLAATKLTNPAVPDYTIGDRLRVDFELQNLGTGKIRAEVQPAHQLKFVLTPRAGDLAGNDVIELPAVNGAGSLQLDVDLGAGGVGAYVGSVELLIPEGVEAKSYYLGILIDVGAAFSEADESNNSAVSATKLVQIASVDLAQALDLVTGEALSTTGDADWYGFALPGALGDAAAFSPQLAAGQRSSFRTKVGVASVVRFQWRASASDAANVLRFNAGAEVRQLSGETDWESVSVAVAAGTDVVWTYEAGAGGAGEQFYVDQLEITPITGPDVLVPQAVLLDASYTPVTSDIFELVAGESSSVLVAYELRNQGQALTDDFEVSVFLSRDNRLDAAEDIRIDQYAYTRDMNSGFSDNLIRSMRVPSDLFGDYFLIVRVDGVAGETAGAVLDNNTYVLDAPQLRVQALPDLSVDLSVGSINGNVFFLGSSIFVNYDLLNYGFGDAFGMIQLRLVFSQDRSYDAASDLTIGQGLYFGGIAARGLTETRKSGSFSIFSIPANLPVGDFRHIGLVVDPDNAFGESNESNNVAFFDNPEYAFGRISLEEALDQSGSSRPYSVSSDLVAPFSAGFPFFGLISDQASDGMDAARSAVIDHGDISYFEVQVTVPEGSDYILNYDWKVSSEVDDKFYLYVDDGSTSRQQAVISGELDWTSAYVLLPGHADDEDLATARDKNYTLRWSYEKNAALSAGSDLAWVDRIRVDALTQPDFAVSELFLTAPDGNPADAVVPLLIGQDRLQLDYRLINIGSVYEGSPASQVNFYLSRDRAVGDDILLGSESLQQLDTGAIQEGQPSFELTNTDLAAGLYYLLAVVDEATAVDEHNKENNTHFTATRLVELVELPDLEITGLEIPEAGSSETLGLHLAGSTLPRAMVTLRNNGAASVLTPFRVQFSLRDVVSGEQIDLGASSRSETLPGAAEQRFNISLIVPTLEQLQGRRFYLEAVVDSTETVTESNENNNSKQLNTLDKVLIFSRVGLAQGLSSSQDFLDTVELENSQAAPFGSDALPFISVDTLLAGETLPVARSILLESGETSKLTINLPDLSLEQAITFEWKADDLSSADFGEPLGGTFQVQLEPQESQGVAAPARVNEFDWTAQVLRLPVGTNNVTFSFTREDALLSEMLDVFAYVRGLRFLPNLTISLDDASIALGNDGSGFSPGGTIEFDAMINNTAFGSVLDGETILVEARLSSDANFDTGDYVLEDLQLVEAAEIAGFVAGTSKTYTFNGVIPPEIAAGDYHLLLRIDPDATIASGDENGPGQVLEVSDADNDSVSALASITIRAKSLEDGLDMESGFNEAYFREVFPGFLTGKVLQTGDATWAGSPDIEVQDFAAKWYATATVSGEGATDDDAIRTAAIDAGSAASLLFRVDRPRLVRFRVKANTANSSNFLFFGANGNELRPEGNLPTRFSGVQDEWQELYYIVPSEAPVGFTYVQGSAPASTGDFADGEFVYVDDLEVRDPIDKPDFVVDTLQYTAGSYVLQRDQLFLIVTGSNRGQSVAPEALPEDFKVRVWLARSLDAATTDTANRIEIGTMEDFQQLDGGTRFAYQASLNLPDSLAEGNYYLIARVDADDVVTEFAIDASNGAVLDNEPAAFSADDNNFLISEAADIFIDRRADLRIVPSLDAVYNQVQLAGPARQSASEIVDFFLIQATPDEGPSELFVKFDLFNEGLSGVSAAAADDFAINVYVASSRNEAPDPERLITSFVVEDGLAAGSRRTFEVTTAIPEYIQAGSFYYLNIVADGDGIIAESDEEDNNTFSRNRNIFVSDVSLEVALNDEALDRYTWDYSFVVPSQIDSTLQAPFFGTKQEFGQDNSDSGVRAAAQSGPVGVGGTSWLQKTVNVISGDQVQVSFLWKVSSQYQVSDLGVAEDILQFSIRFQGDDTFTPIAYISGERDWAEYIHTITEPGVHALRWTYIENGDDIRVGADAGWVDDYSEASFDFIPVFGEPSGTFSDGDRIELPAYVWNLGQLQMPDAGVEVEMRLVQETGDVSNLDWTVPYSLDVTLQQTVRYDQLTLQQLLDLQTLLKDEDLRSGVVTTQELNASMDAAILQLLAAEEAEVEPELTADEIATLRGKLGEADDGITWLDFIADDLALILAEAGTPLERFARRRFLPVRTYRYLDDAGNLSDSRHIRIPDNLSIAGDYKIGMWVNPQGLLTESNVANNLEYSVAASVKLEVGTTIPDALDLDEGILLSNPVDWNLSGQGRWFPEEDPAAMDGDRLSSPPDSLGQDGEASISALVEGPRLIRFSWRSELAGSQDTASFFVNGNLALRESEGGANPSAISLSSDDDTGDPSGWKEEQYFLPAGLNEIRWTFTRGDDAKDQGRAYLDHVRFEAVANRADFAISSIDYTGGSYALERDTFPVTIVVVNRGAMPAGFNYNDLDVELRLGLNSDFSTAVQIVGNLGVVDVLDQGQRLIFQGTIDLPVNLDQGTYYLLAQVQSLDPSFQEFTYDTGEELTINNYFASAVQDVTISHLPQLEVTTTRVENEKLYYPQETIRFDWQLRNVGLGNIPFGTSLSQQIELWAVDIDEEDPGVATGQKVADVGTVTEITSLYGRLEAENEAQSTIEYKQTYRLPSQAELLGALGSVIPGLEDRDVLVVNALGDLENFKFFFVLTRDQSIEQASDLNVTAVTDEIFRISAFPFDDNDSNPENDPRPDLDLDASVTFQQWIDFVAPRLEELGLPKPEGTADARYGTGGDAIELLYYYAFNLPLVEDLSPVSPRIERNDAGEAGYYQMRTIQKEGLVHPAITFPMVRGAADLTYRVEAKNEADAVWTELVSIKPPYLDTDGVSGMRAGFVGARTLTEENNSAGIVSLVRAHPEVFSVVDNNYSAAVTVYDEGGRDQLRVVVEQREPPVAELALALPGTGTVGTAAYVKGADGVQWLTPVNTPMSTGDALQVNFDIWSVGELDQQSARLQIRLVEDNTGSEATLDWSVPDLEAVILFDGLVELEHRLNGNNYHAFRSAADPGNPGSGERILTIPESAMGDKNFYLAVWVDYLNEVTEASEPDASNNLVITGSEGSADTPLAFSNRLTVEAAIDSDLIRLDLDGNPATVDETLTWTQSGDALWFPVYDTGAGGSAPAGASGGEALSSPPLDQGQTAKLRTSLGSAPREIEFDWLSRTSSADSFLSVISVESGQILFSTAGNSVSEDWQTASIIVPAGVEIEFRYTQSTINRNDRVYIDNLVVLGELTLPDFILQGIDITDEDGVIVDSGSYVLERDPLYVNISTLNQGTDSPGNFHIEVYLSRDAIWDAGDVLVRDYFENQGDQFLSGNGAVNGFAIDLPLSLEAGAYYLIAVINRDQADIDEGNRTSNNLLATATASVEILRLPDLLITDFTALPDYYTIENGSGGRNRLDFEFTIENQGLGNVDGPFSIKVVLSSDNTLAPDSDYTVLEYTFNGSLAPGSKRLIDPDSVELRNNTPLGQYQFMGAYIDAADAVLESNESNNGSVFLDNDYVFSLRTLREGLDLDTAGLTARILNDETAPYVSNAQPWVVQSAQSVDGVDAVTNVLIGDDESASFSVVVNPASDVRASFWWKVSSQNELVEGINQRDILSFSVDGVEAVAPIFGTDNPDWRRVEVPLSAGPHTLTWTYSKDDQGSGGDDRGWVDNLVISELPNLQVSGISLDEAPVYRPDGDTIDTWSVTVTNSGARGIEPGTAFDVALRLMPTADWPDAAARTLLTITDTSGLAAGASRTYNQVSHGELDLPAGDYSDEFYYYAAYADWLPGDPLSGQITESFEDDNLTLSATAGLQLGLPDVVTAGVGGVAGSYSYSGAYALDVSLDNIGEGVLLSGGDFNLRVFLVPGLEPGVADSSKARELDTITVSSVEVAAGGSLVVQTVSGSLPYGIANGSYYIGVQVDGANELTEQSALSVADGDPRDRADGEGNNLFFSSAAVFSVDNGISLAEVLDQPALTIETSGDAQWFSRDDAGDLATADDNRSFVDNDGLQSPVLAEGESASFAFVSASTYMVGFDYVVATGSSANHLSVQVNGEERARFSGNDAARVEVQVAAGDRISWVYTQGEAASTDAAYVDNLSLTPVVSPDLTVLGLELTQSGEVIDSGRYVLQRDRLDLSVVSRNLGTDVPGHFSVKIYLSRDSALDGGDTLIRTYFEDQGTKFLSGNSAVNGFSIDLPTSLEAGDYHVIAVIDSENDIAEFSELNNSFVSPTAAVEIVRLPDLVVTGFNATPGYYLVEDATSLRDFLDFEFRIANNGLADASGPLTIRVLLSADSELVPDADYTVLEYTYNGSLLVGDSVLVDPDAADIRTDVPLGAYQFMGAFIDAADAVLESNESNNGSVFLDNDYVFSLRTLREGLDLDTAGLTARILNDETAPYVSNAQPWVVQSAQSVDGADAVTNVLIGDDESASFSVVVNPASDVRASFWWKVSSQNELVEGINQRDILSFSVDGVEAVAPIFGTDNPDWRRVEVALSAGPHTLTWTYSKDDQGSGGDDRGWVDNLVISELPNLQVSGISLDEAPVYRPDGDTIDTWSVTVTNSGARGIEPGTAFDVALRLMPTADWPDAAARTLLTITDTSGLAAGASRTYNQVSHGALFLPAGDYSDEFYYYAAYADWLPGDPLSGQITESFEDDNLTLSSSAGLQLGLPDVVTAGVGGVAGSYSYTGAYALDVSLDNIGEGVLLSGSDFDVRVFLVPGLEPGVADSSKARELDTITVSSEAVAAGGSLVVQTVSGSLPYGIANGSYYIGVQVDGANELTEQSALSVADGDPRDRADGEGNNLFFSSAAVFSVDNGISLAEALDQPALTIETSGDAQWFSRDDAGDLATADDDRSFVDNDGLQSPVLAEGESASFAFVSAVSQLVRFDWAITGSSAANRLSVSVNGIERARIDSDTAAAGVEVLVSSGSTVRWTYTVGDAPAAGPAYVDNIELVTNDRPDLAITEVNYVAGEYVLDRSATGTLLQDGRPQYLHTKFLDVSVTAENQGEDLPATVGTFTLADIEVRLSRDSEYGNIDDIMLGNFAQVEGNFNEDNLLSFLGPIALGDHIPEGFYYLMVRIDPNDRVNTEFTEQNNFWCSEQADVQITRLPDLRIENVDGRFETSLYSEVLNFADILDVDETGTYQSNGKMRIRFNIHNRGLAAVDGAEGFVTQVNLRGIRRPEVSGEPLGIESLSDVPGAATEPIILGEFIIQDELLGRTATSNGDTKAVDIELFLPDSVYFLDVMEEGAYVSDYLWFIEVIVDLENDVEESAASNNTWWAVDVLKLLDPVLPAVPSVDWRTAVNGDDDDGLFGMDFIYLSSEADWEAFYGLVADASGTDVEVANFLAYAFNRNPADGDTDGKQFPGSYGITRSDDEYLSVTFDFVARAADLQYTIQADDDVTFPSPDILLTITPPYLELTGAASLTGAGGLIEAANVLSVIEFGNTARITVRDSSDVATSPTRFIRVIVDSVDTTPVPVP